MCSKILRRAAKGVALMTLLLPALANASGMVIVNENETTEVNQKDIKNLYLGNSNQVNGKHFVPLLTKDKKTKTEFINEVLETSVARYRANWAKRVFTSRGVPPREMAEEKVLDYVGGNGDYIGVVSDKNALTRQRAISNF